MKPSPFYRDEEQLKELIAKRDNFTFAADTSPAKLLVLIAGKEGSGKTHLACTMSELGPVYLIDTEYRAQIVTRKFKNVKLTPAKNFPELVVAIKHILKYCEPGTIVIDSGTDLQTFAEIEYLERSEKDKVGMPWNWAEVWRLCNAVIDDVKFSQKFHLVITSRIKEEYVADRPTGQTIPRIYSTLPYKSDVVLQFANTEKDRHLVATKNGFTGELQTELGPSLSLPSMIRQLSQPKVAAPPKPSNGEVKPLRRIIEGTGIRKAS